MFCITRQSHYKALKELKKEALGNTLVLELVKEKRKNQVWVSDITYIRIKSEKLIHHSDRGVQYCCKEYTSLLIKKGITISMTEVDHCYENAYAERVNGILKQEYGLEDTFNNEQQALKAVKEAVFIYNTDRLHTSLGFKTLDMVYFKEAV